jgi:hypothetical protein
VLPSPSIHDDETIQRKVIDSRRPRPHQLRTETSELGLGFKPGSLAPS